MKLLLVCYECSPYIGSEWAVGWGRLLGAAKVGETHVVTSEANARHLQRAREEGLVPGNVYVHTPAPDERLRRLEKKPGLFAYNYTAYHHWHRLALKQMRTLHAIECFDLVHQVNVCTFREPGFAAELGIPFVWGPVGGSQNFPTRFLGSLPAKEACKESFRAVANRLTLRKRRLRRAAQRASRVFAANSTNRRDFRKHFRCDVDLLLETGLHEVHEADRTRFHRRIVFAKHGDAEPLRLLWSGELHTRKALPVLLHALALLDRSHRWQLDILGAGPMEAKWRAEVQRLGVADSVCFLGKQTFADAVAQMQKAHVLCFTSLRDTSGNVVLEALAAGVPVICFDHQGAGDVVDATCGIKVPVSHPRKAHQDWCAAVQTLVIDPHRLLALSHGATHRAKDFLWTKNHDKMAAVYRELSGSHQYASERALTRSTLALADEAGVPVA